MFVDSQCNILVLTNFKNFSLIHEKMKELVLNIDYLVIQPTTWLDLQEVKLSGKTLWDKFKDKHPDVLLSFPLNI